MWSVGRSTHQDGGAGGCLTISDKSDLTPRPTKKDRMVLATMASKPKKPKKPTRAEARRFLQAVGWFVTMFSIIENQVHAALWHFAGINPVIASCILSGTRIDAALGYLKRIAEATDWPEARKDSLNGLALQLGEITKLRNDLLHYGTSGGETADTWVVTNEKYAHIETRIRATKLSVFILEEQLVSDLLMIMIQLSVLKGEISDTVLPLLSSRALRHVWRYKPDRQRSSGAKAL